MENCRSSAAATSSHRLPPGDVVRVTVTDSKPHYLIADSGIQEHRRTKAGDNSAAGEVPTTAPVGVGLGLPTIGQPAAQPSGDSSCGC